MDYRIEFEQEEDGRWIADIPELPGVMAEEASGGDGELATAGADREPAQAGCGR